MWNSTVACLFTTTATPSTAAVSNVLINPSLIGTKNILITTNMVSQNSSSESLKRKHEEDDDYDALWWRRRVLLVRTCFLLTDKPVWTGKRPAHWDTSAAAAERRCCGVPARNGTLHFSVLASVSICSVSWTAFSAQRSLGLWEFTFTHKKKIL